MELSSVPRLATGCRVHPTRNVLLIPEGTLELTGSAHAVLTRLDGHRAISNILDELQQEFEGASVDEMQSDILALLDKLQRRGVVRA